MGNWIKLWPKFQIKLLASFFSSDVVDEEEDRDEDMGNMPREKILERIRHHKEIIGKVRLQPWPMRRKRRALKVARQYLQRQEAQVSKWNLYKVELGRRFNQVRQ